ncbi:MAG: TAXI family TRAP transporter solute-binding subunit [Qingshengfaniella sp.]
MKRLTKALGLALGMGLAATGASQAKDFYTMATLGPGSSPYLVMSTLAQMVEKKTQGDIQIQINATGAATQHAIGAAMGQLDFYMWSASVHDMMAQGGGMYSQIPQAPDLAKKLRAVLAFPLGLYHMVVYEDSGINSLEDLAGKRVFLGPPGGGATIIMQRVVEGATGLKAGQDYEQIQLGWDAASQAFQDGRIDVYVNATNAPSPVIQQMALSRKIKLLSLTEEQRAKEAVQAILNRPGGVLGTIPAGTYGDNQANIDDVTTLGSIVGVAAGETVDAEGVYRITKAFWESVEENANTTPWLRSVKLENALEDLNLPLHPGALRYYEEIGMTIPDELRPPE